MAQAITFGVGDHSVIHILMVERLAIEMSHNTGFRESVVDRVRSVTW